MKNILKSTALIAVGIFIGASISISNADLKKINAVRDNITSIFIRGEKVNLTKQDTPLSYKNRLYVPLRLLTENMGMVVDYDKSGKSVYITDKPLTNEEKLSKETKIYEEPEAESKKIKSDNIDEARKEDIVKKSDIDYKNLPISFKKDKFFMRLTLAIKENSNYNSEFYFDVKNEGEIGVVIDPSSAKFDYSDEHAQRQIGVEEVSIRNMHNKILSSLDPGYNDTVYLNLNKIPKNVKQGTLSFNIYTLGDLIGGKKEITKVIMPIKFD